MRWGIREGRGTEGMAGGWIVVGGWLDKGDVVSSFVGK